MQISRIRIQNFKSFRDSHWINLGPSWTVIVGQNNSGKTALLQSFRFSSCPNVPYRGPLPFQPEFGHLSTFDSDIKIPVQMLRSLLDSGAGVYIPVPNNEDQQKFIHDLLSMESITISCRSHGGREFYAYKSPSHGLFPEATGVGGNLVQYNDAIKGFAVYGDGRHDALPELLHGKGNSNIYVFDPERLKIGSCKVVENSELDPSGRNLPAVLVMMARNPSKWDNFKGHIREIFPSVRDIAISALGDEIAIYIWQNTPETAQGDYAVLLQESGTGLAQVLCILYVAMTRTESVIVIDEPNSFLHPGAAKMLMHVLKQYKQNQYIVSTHSPELISVIEPDVLLSVSWSGGESHVETLDRHSLDDLGRVLLDLGCELADVFSVDRVVWCEGPTEVSSFPIIARLAGINTATTAFLKLRATGDLEGRKVDANAVLDVYHNLSNGPSLLPREAIFNFDLEGRSAAEIAKIRKRTTGKVKFLPARTLENFVLDAEAIAALLEEEYARTETDGSPPSVAQVKNWLAEKWGDYAPKERKGDCPIEEIDAPKLLNALFSELTNNLHIYRKTLHTVELIRWLMKNRPEKLANLIEYVRQLVEEH